jgi:hypothetical protein
LGRADDGGGRRRRDGGDDEAEGARHFVFRWKLECVVRGSFEVYNFGVYIVGRCISDVPGCQH